MNTSNVKQRVDEIVDVAWYDRVLNTANALKRDEQISAIKQLISDILDQVELKERAICIHSPSGIKADLCNECSEWNQAADTVHNKIAEIKKQL